MTHRMGIAVSLGVCAALTAATAFAQTKKAQPPAKLFTTPLTMAEMTGKQAVIETSLGRIVIDLLPAKAPNHVGYFIKLAKEGAYDGTTFHRLIKHGIIQGGDPVSKDPAKAAHYGTGGLRVLAFEPGEGSHVAGAVSSVLLPGNKNSAGSQFFVCVTPQAALDGQYTVFGRVVEGIGIVTLISEAAVDQSGKAADRIEMTSVTIRDAPPAGVEPFSAESPAELGAHRAVLETSLGPITLEFIPDKAPTHVRNFLRLAAAGVYDRTSFHRVVPAFMIQTGYLGSKTIPMDPSQKALVRTLDPEFNDTPHEKGVVSMARGQDPASASTSFFIMTTRVSSFDGHYTAFARVVDGMSVVDAIEKAPREGEAPTPRIDLLRVRVSKK